MLHVTNQSNFVHQRKSIRKEVLAHKERMRRIYSLITFIILLVAMAFVSYYLVNYVFQPETPSNGDVPISNGILKAALLDPLYSTIPNDEFTRSLTKTLDDAGFEVEVFQGTEVTVDFLKDVSAGYNLIVLRMHSALHDGELYLFTGEPYSVGKYTEEQYFRIVKEAYATESSESVFAVNWGFIKRCMTGAFNDTFVIAMGCDGAGDSVIIEEFMNQGAVGYVSWSGPVLISHSDSATLQLSKYLYVDEMSPQEATQKTNQQLGEDPSWGTVLEYYSP